jgi:phosphoglucosamine mutase
MKIFGSDGFRCKFGEDFLTDDSIKNFAFSLAYYYLDKGFDDPILIARDTRDSGRIIESILVDTLINQGVDVCLANVLPTPGLSKILQLYQYAFGCMITASHNHHDDNGIKLLESSGFKISLKAQSAIENFMLQEKISYPQLSKSYGTLTESKNAFDTYASTMVKTINLSHFDESILVDCSNGAYSHGLAEVCSQKNIKFTCNKPNGNNINLNCGALHGNNLLKKIIESKIDYGIAFDGDGDRAIFASKGYGVIETEKVATLFFDMLSKQNDSLTVVTSEISNLAFKHNIESFGGTVIETPVGDRFVIEATDSHNALFGFEPSGHFYFPNSSHSMDGLAAMLNFLNLIASNVDLNLKLKDLSQYNRIQKNYDIKNNKSIDELELLASARGLIDPNNEKLILRKSMWDPVIRLYYDFKEVNNYELLENSIYKELDNLGLV